MIEKVLGWKFGIYIFNLCPNSTLDVTALLELDISYWLFWQCYSFLIDNEKIVMFIWFNFIRK